MISSACEHREAQSRRLAVDQSRRRQSHRARLPNRTPSRRQACADAGASGPRCEAFHFSQDSIAGSPLQRSSKHRQVDLARGAAERELEIRETWDRGRDTEYRYDEDGNLTRRRVDGRFQEGAYQGGRLTTFEYDPLSRERRMEVSDRPEDPDAQSRDWTTSYHPSGEIDVLEKPNGTTERHFFRADGLIESIRRETEAAGEDADKDATYSYDSNSNRTADERGTYAYNARDQLVLWDPEGTGEGNEPTSYVLNGSGQISEERSPELRSTYTYAGHRLSERKDDYTDPQILDATYRYRYDDFGNTTRIRGPGAGTSEPPPDITGACEGAANWTAPDTAYFCWDEFSRLNTSKGAETSRSAVAVYVHDGLDRRDFRITSGNGASELRREYSYVGLSELLSRERRDADEGKEASYDYSSQGRRLAQRTQGDQHSSTRYYATDAQGSVEALEAPDGTIAADETYAYDPYGALDTEGDPTADPEDDLSERAQANPFRFQGSYYDSAIKSYDMQAREYSPTEGRFLTQDRFASAGADLQLQTDPLTQNRYVFAGGNPVTRVEWDGHAPVCNGPGGRPVPCDMKGNPSGSKAQQKCACPFQVPPASSGSGGSGGASEASLYPVGQTPPSVVAQEAGHPQAQLPTIARKATTFAKQACNQLAEDGCPRVELARGFYAEKLGADPRLAAAESAVIEGASTRTKLSSEDRINLEADLLADLRNVYELNVSGGSSQAEIEQGLETFVLIAHSERGERWNPPEIWGKQAAGFMEGVFSPGVPGVGEINPIGWLRENALGVHIDQDDPFYSSAGGVGGAYGVARFGFTASRIHQWLTKPTPRSDSLSYPGERDLPCFQTGTC